MGITMAQEKRFLFILGAGHDKKQCNHVLDKFKDIDVIYDDHINSLHSYKKNHENDSRDLTVLFLAHGSVNEDKDGNKEHYCDFEVKKTEKTSATIKQIQDFTGTNKIIMASCYAGAIPKTLQKNFQGDDIDVLVFGSSKYKTFVNENIDTLYETKKLLENKECQNTIDLFAKISAYSGQTLHLARIADNEFSSVKRQAREKSQEITSKDKNNEESQLLKQVRESLQKHANEEENPKKANATLEAMHRNQKDRALEWLKSINLNQEKSYKSHTSIIKKLGNILLFSAEYNQLEIFDSVLKEIKNKNYPKSILESKNFIEDTILHCSLANQNTQIVESIFKNLGNSQKLNDLITSKNGSNKTALHLAAANNNPEAIKLIFDELNNPDDIEKLINERDCHGNTAFHYAVFSNNLNSIASILNISQDPKSLVAAKDQDTRTFLHLAAKNKNSEAIKLIFDKLDNPNDIGELINEREHDGSSAFHYIVTFDDTDLTKTFLDKSKNPKKLITAQDQDNRTSLHLAAKNNNSKAIELIFDTLNNPDDIEKLINEIDYDGNTALHYAVLSNDIDSTTSILNRSQDVKKLITIENQDDKNPLHLAVQNKNLEMVKLLLKKLDNQKDIEELISEKNKFGHTVLYQSVKNNNAEMVKELLKNVKDEKIASEIITSKSNKGYTVLHYAAANNSMEILKELLDNLHDTNLIKNLINQEDKDKSTVLHLAVENDNVEMVEYLLEKVNTPDKSPDETKKLIDKQDKSGNSALHIAAIKKCSAEIIEKLLNHGADINLRNKRNDTPEDIAEKRKNSVFIETLDKFKEIKENSLSLSTSGRPPSPILENSSISQDKTQDRNSNRSL